MAFTENITDYKTFNRYLAEIGEIPSYHIKKCFDCGLPAVWLYMRAIGLEDLFFVMLKKTKISSIWFRELFYLLMLTNSNNPYFPSLPSDAIQIDIPKEFKEAQIDMPQPEFQLEYSFTRDQLIKTLEQLILPGKLLRLGNKQRAIALMRNEDSTISVYQAGNSSPMVFNSVEKTTDFILGIINGH